MSAITAVVGEEDVAGVRVGVEEAVDEYLLEVGVEEMLGELVAVEVDLAERRQRSVIFRPEM